MESLALTFRDMILLMFLQCVDSLSGCCFEDITVASSVCSNNSCHFIVRFFTRDIQTHCGVRYHDILIFWTFDIRLFVSTSLNLTETSPVLLCRKRIRSDKDLGDPSHSSGRRVDVINGSNIPLLV